MLTPDEYPNAFIFTFCGFTFFVKDFTVISCNMNLFLHKFTHISHLLFINRKSFNLSVKKQNKKLKGNATTY